MLPAVAIFLGFLVLLSGLALFISLKKISLKRPHSIPENIQKKADKAMAENNYLDAVTEKYSVSLSLPDALEALNSVLLANLTFDAFAYVIQTSETKAIFKCVANVGVSKDYVASLKNELVIRLDNPQIELEEYVVGAPTGAGGISKFASRLIIPLKNKDTLVGYFSITHKNANTFDSQDEAFIVDVLDTTLSHLINLKDVIEREKAKFRTMVDSMTDGVVMFDGDFKVLVDNPALYKLTGIQDSIGVNIMDLDSYFAPAFSLREELSAVFTTNTPKDFDNVNLDDKYFEIALIPIRNGDSLSRVGMIVYDKTQEKELEKLRRDFSAMVIHELRSPLTVIKGISDLLLTQADRLSLEQKNEFLVQIKASTDALLDKVNDLLDAAKIESGKIELFKSDVDIANLLESTKYYYDTLAQQNGIQIVMKLDSAINHMRLDEKKIRQVLDNLLSNAIKHTPQGGTITIRSEVNGSNVDISVADTGKGVSDDLKSRIFERYVQGKDSQAKGTGLGLVIARGIIEAHGGNLWVEDNIPQGAKFVFTLPKAGMEMSSQ